MDFRFFEKSKMIFYLSAGGCILMMLFPNITLPASKEAIQIWMNAVVPSLLPFMMIAGCIKKTGAEKLSGTGFYPVFMAFLSGYPMGAKLAGEAYRDGKTDEKGFYRTLCYGMITGPAFLIGGVGAAFYGSKTIGYLLAFSHYAGALTCGFALGRSPKRPTSFLVKENRAGTHLTDTPFTDCILESFKTLGIILGYIVLFMIGTEFVESTGFLDGLSEENSAFCKGLLEMTVGCSQIASCSCSLEKKLVLSSFVLSFGGLSVIGQTMSMLTDCPVTLSQILKIKVFHGIFSAIWTFTIWSFVV